MPVNIKTSQQCLIKVITKLPNSEQSYKGKVKTHNYINRQNQSTTGKMLSKLMMRLNQITCLEFSKNNIINL